MPPCLANKIIMQKPTAAANKLSIFFLKDENWNMNNGVEGIVSMQNKANGCFVLCPYDYKGSL